jgi:hypothetical protein
MKYPRDNRARRMAISNPAKGQRPRSESHLCTAECPTIRKRMFVRNRDGGFDQTDQGDGRTAPADHQRCDLTHSVSVVCPGL